MRYTSKDWETDCLSGNLRRIPRVLIDGAPAENVMTADTDAGYVDVLDGDAYSAQGAHSARIEIPTKRLYGVVKIQFTYV